jgi:hypothetical protein
MEYVRAITSDHDLIALAKLIGVHIDNILEINELNDTIRLGKGSYIILLRSNGGVGHWVCVCDGKYFDPTGVGPPKKLGDLTYNEIQYQGTYGEFCGVWCLLWLYTKQKNKPELLEGFHNLDIDVLND